MPVKRHNRKLLTFHEKKNAKATDHIFRRYRVRTVLVSIPPILLRGNVIPRLASTSLAMSIRRRRAVLSTFTGTLRMSDRPADRFPIEDRRRIDSTRAFLAVDR